MINLEEFRSRHGVPTQKTPFLENELLELARQLPADIIQFLSEEGLCRYGNGALWTVHPNDFHEILTDWGLEGKKCFTFLRTAFGGCIYYYKKNFYLFDSLGGTINCLNDDVYTLMSIYLTFDFFLYDTWHLDILDKHPGLPPLQYDEVYAFVPALPFGGSLETSHLEVVKIREHLAFLAELFGNKVRKL